jgi:hypothetical protein
MHTTELDVPAPFAVVAQEVNLDGVELDDRIEVLGAASRAVLQWIPERVLGARVVGASHGQGTITSGRSR